MLFSSIDVALCFFFPKCMKISISFLFIFGVGLHYLFCGFVITSLQSRFYYFKMS